MILGKNRKESIPMEEILPIEEVRAFIAQLPQLNIPLSEGLELFSEFIFSFISFWRTAEDNPIRLRTPNNPNITVTGYSDDEGFPESSEYIDRPGQYLISPELLDNFEDLIAFVNSIILSMKRYTSDLKTFSGFLEKIPTLWCTSEKMKAMRESNDRELLSQAAEIKHRKKQYASLAAYHRISSKRRRRTKS